MSNTVKKNNINKKETEPAKKSFNKKLIFAGAALVLAVIIGVIAVPMMGERGTPAKTLEGYLTALYCNTKIVDMKTYLIEDIQQACYDNYTYYGTSIAIMQQMQFEKVQEVGDNFTISVKSDKETACSGTALKAAAEAYDATSLMDVNFTVTFEGPAGTSEYAAIARLAKIGSEWFLTEYDIPMAKK